MKPHKSIFSLLILALLVSCAAPEVIVEAPVITEPDEIERWELVWSDEFNGVTIKFANWTYDTGAGGWGNNELQNYTDREENARIEDGMLVIEAREEEYKASDYTSARIKTQELQSWTYGRVEARMKLPAGKGVWSAFWMLGEDIATSSWPDCGEIDIMENIGDPKTVYGTVHGPGYSGGDGVGSSYYSSDTSFAEEFHTYAVEWQPGEISWFVDDVLYNTISDADVSGAWVYDHDFFIIFNLAVGGLWPGYPDETTVFPQQLLVDYVRVYRNTELTEEDLAGGSVHIAEMTMEMDNVEEKWQGTAYVTVVDEGGNPVEGAVVSAGWVGAASGGTLESKTDENGVAGPFIATKLSHKEDLSFCVSKVSKILHEYDKDANVQNCVIKAP
ncbi:MAG: family 16 glycosylhydrolase [Chloroflexi bacterium]|nr:family 16 glycosylhydrolase [Chloroflexota bacterium]